MLPRASMMMLQSNANFLGFAVTPSIENLKPTNRHPFSQSCLNKLEIVRIKILLSVGTFYVSLLSMFTMFKLDVSTAETKLLEKYKENQWKPTSCFLNLFILSSILT